MLKEELIKYLKCLGFKRQNSDLYINFKQGLSVKFNKNQNTCSIYRTDFHPLFSSQGCITITVKEKCNYETVKQILKRLLQKEEESITKEDLIKFLKEKGFIETGKDYFEYELDESRNWQLDIDIVENITKDFCIVTKVENQYMISNNKIINEEVNGIIGYFSLGETKNL